MKVRYYPLVNRVISTLRIRDRLLKEASVEKHFFERPFITIAREPGSGGSPIARALGEKLNFVVKSESIVDAVAKSIKKRRAIIKSVDEKGRTYLDDIIQSVLNPQYLNESVYAKELSKVILTIAHKGNVVILGRGANFITPFARGLHVNIVAPYGVRVQRAMEYEGFSEKKAKAVIARVEKERVDFVKTYFKKDLTKSNAYDLTLNTTYYSIDQSVDIIIEAFRRKFPAFQRLKATFLG